MFRCDKGRSDFLGESECHIDLQFLDWTTQQRPVRLPQSSGFGVRAPLHVQLQRFFEVEFRVLEMRGALPQQMLAVPFVRQRPVLGEPTTAGIQNGIVESSSRRTEAAANRTILGVKERVVVNDVGILFTIQMTGETLQVDHDALAPWCRKEGHVLRILPKT